MLIGVNTANLDKLPTWNSGDEFLLPARTERREVSRRLPGSPKLEGRGGELLQYVVSLAQWTVAVF